MYKSRIKFTGPIGVYNKVTNSRNICCYRGTQYMHKDRKKVSLSSLHSIPET